MDQYIGKFLDNRYELLEVIGTGGMAVVYKARCHRLNRLVAVKVLKSDLAQDAEFRRRFHDESQAVAMLSHPNIVAVYDVSHSDDLDYIVMELIDGITLKQYMQKKGPCLNWREALHFITQIMRALSHAHSRGIIHRDIKPHNIMVLRDGSVKVSDFGIARITSARQSTLTQEALGSVHYISPEQARGSHIDARSDIYSAGVVLYEMITDRLPFEGETPVAVAIQHINSIPLSPRELNADIPEALEAITMKAMAPDPDERYLNADEMLSDLEEFRKNPNINFDYSTEDLRSGDEPTRPVPVGPVQSSAGEETSRRRRLDELVEDDDEDDYDDDGRGPIWPILLAVGAILVFIVCIVGFLWSSFFSDLLNPQRSDGIRVPDLVGMTLSQAERIVGDDFTIEQGAPEYREDYPAGQVFRQEPEGNAESGEDGKITVFLSLGPENSGEGAAMPTVENMDARLAMELLRDRMGLTVTEQKESSDDITKGFAIRTVPRAGEPVKEGASVTLIVSTGPEVKTMELIDFTNQKLERVQAQLVQMELTQGEVFDVPTPVDQTPPGTVLRQSPRALTTVTAGTAIDLWVSVAPSAEPSAEASPSPSVQPSAPVESDHPVAGPSAAPASEPPTPPPTPVQPPMNSKAIFVHLPAWAEDKSSVQVRIEVDGGKAYSQNVETALFPISPLVSGRGTQQISVYIDGTLTDQYMESFS